MALFPSLTQPHRVARMHFILLLNWTNPVSVFLNYKLGEAWNRIICIQSLTSGAISVLCLSGFLPCAFH